MSYVAMTKRPTDQVSSVLHAIGNQGIINKRQNNCRIDAHW